MISIIFLINSNTKSLYKISYNFKMNPQSTKEVKSLVGKIDARTMGTKSSR
jgi:hypothetical protein